MNYAAAAEMLRKIDFYHEQYQRVKG